MATKWTKESILLKLTELHPNLDFSNFTFISTNHKSVIICKKHGPREMKVMNLLRGNGCRLCKPQHQKRSIDKIILQFNNIHNFKYEYLFHEYQNQNQIIEIKCPIHGIFEQQIIHHTNGSGCTKCHDRTFNRKDLEQHILKIPKIHRLKFDYLDIDYNYKNNGKTFLKLKCLKCSDIFWQNLSNHTNGSGCKKCSDISNQSKGIIKIINFLHQLNINYELEKTFINCINPKTGYKLRFDIYIPILNYCIEFDGQQHFNNIEYFGGEESLLEIQFRDKIKTEYCKNNDIKLLRIKYDENIENILKDRINKLCQ